MRVAYKYACYDNGVLLGIAFPEHWEWCWEWDRTVAMFRR